MIVIQRALRLITTSVPNSSAIGRTRKGGLALASVLAVSLVTSAAGQVAATNAPSSKLRSGEDGWLDVSGFLDERYGFLPIAFPITEPAVGYGAAGGPAFISKAPGTSRPNITMLGGMGTENGSWGAMAGDLRHWMDGRLQTLVGAIYASINLDYHGIGQDSVLSGDPLRYTLEPKGGFVQSRCRLGESAMFAGLGYAFASTEVSFDAPVGTPGLPEFQRDSNVGGIAPSVTLDTRDNLFTPTRGTYIETSAGLFSEALGGDDEFQRVQLIAMHYLPLHPRLFLGLRGQMTASFGDAPFYMRPFIYMRGVAAMRYQGEETAQIEGELRWQFWKRFSLVGFAGGGAAWNDFERIERAQSALAGGTGFRYELARKYGIHMGVDVAFGPDDPAVYIQVGSAWARP